MIRVNAVSPGNTYFDGGAWQNVEKNLPDLFKHALSLNPTGRMAKPEEIGRGIVFLASPASSFTSGTNLVIDGALPRACSFREATKPGPWTIQHKMSDSWVLHMKAELQFR